jgi:hypothetical protein
MFGTDVTACGSDDVFLSVDCGLAAAAAAVALF